MKIAFLSHHTQDHVRLQMIERYGLYAPKEADILVPLGGDGFMLETIHKYRDLNLPIYGMHRGTVGFLMNAFHKENLIERIQKAEKTVINPLKMRAELFTGEIVEKLAINEVSLLRAGSQAARLKVLINGKTRIEQLVCDGAMLSTPAGSTAYNYSAHGPIIPIEGNILALTAVAPFRPRRWRGALISMNSEVRFEVEHPEKRPVHASADSFAIGEISAVVINASQNQATTLLFDADHGLEERLLQEQFL